MAEGKQCKRCGAGLRGRETFEAVCGACRREPAALIIDHDTLEVIDESVERADGQRYTRRELKVHAPRKATVRCSKRVPEVA